MVKALIVILYLSHAMYCMENQPLSLWKLEPIKHNPTLLEKIQNAGLNIVYFKGVPISSTVQSAVTIAGPNASGFVIVANEGYQLGQDIEPGKVNLNHFHLFGKQPHQVLPINFPIKLLGIHPQQKIFFLENNTKRKLCFEYNSQTHEYLKNTNMLYENHEGLIQPQLLSLIGLEVFSQSLS